MSDGADLDHEHHRVLPLDVRPQHDERLLRPLQQLGRTGRAAGWPSCDSFTLVRRVGSSDAMMPARASTNVMLDHDLTMLRHLLSARSHDRCTCGCAHCRRHRRRPSSSILATISARDLRCYRALSRRTASARGARPRARAPRPAGTAGRRPAGSCPAARSRR